MRSHWLPVTAAMVRCGVIAAEQIVLARLVIVLDPDYCNDLAYVFRLRGRITRLDQQPLDHVDQQRVLKMWQSPLEPEERRRWEMPRSFTNGVAACLCDVTIPFSQLPDGSDFHPYRENALLPCRIDPQPGGDFEVLAYSTQQRDARHEQFIQALSRRSVRTNAVIIQANKDAFLYGQETLPATVLISFDRDLPNRENYLRRLAQRAFDLKERQKPANPDEQAVSDILWAGEKGGVYYRRFQLPQGFTGGPVVYAADLWLYRPYLRDRCLGLEKILPVIAEPGPHGGIELLPFHDREDDLDVVEPLETANPTSKRRPFLEPVDEVLPAAAPARESSIDALAEVVSATPPAVSRKRRRLLLVLVPLVLLVLLLVAGVALAYALVHTSGTTPPTTPPAVIAPLRTLNVSKSYVWSVSFSKDGQSVLTADGLRGPGQVQRWPINGGDPETRWTQPVDVFGAAFAPDEQSIAVAGGEKGVHRVDLGKFGPSSTQGHPSYVRGVAFSPDGRSWASLCEKKLRVWDAAGQEKWQADLKPDLAWWRGAVHFAFSPDSATLAAPDGGNDLHLYDAATGQVLHACAGHQGVVLCAAFSRDGKECASGGMDNTIKIWATATGREVKTLSGQNDWIHAVAYSPDGKTLASAGRGQGNVVLWDVSTGSRLVELPHQEAMCVAYSPDGKTLASSGGDGTVKLWDVSKVAGQ